MFAKLLGWIVLRVRSDTTKDVEGTLTFGYRTARCTAATVPTNPAGYVRSSSSS